MRTYDGSGYSVAAGSFPLPTPNTGVDSTYLARALANALAGFQDGLGSQATWANNALEAGGTADMIGATCSKLLGFGRALDRGASKSYLAELLGISHQKSKWGNTKAASKSFGDAWLSWHFGWSPMAADIGAAMEHINDPGGFSQKIRGRAQLTYDTTDRTFNPGIELSFTRTTSRFFVEVGATVQLISPILASLSQLGFVNPLTVAWEAIPYSFVGDWFTNVGQFLGQSTMMEGFTKTRTYFTEYTVTNGTNSSISLTGNAHDATYDYHGACKHATVDRTVGFPAVPLVWKPFKGFSAARGATAAALLAQFLSSH
jgi:hypothetical protein